MQSPAAPSLLRRALRLLGRAALLLVALVVLVVALLFAIARHPRPAGGTPGPEADALARRIEASVDTEAFRRTGALRFRFLDHHYLWDRRRSLARVRHGEREVLLDLRRGDARGRAFERGAAVEGEAGRALVQHAWERFLNDTFWLNPLAKLFDDGVERLLVPTPDGPSLLVRYTSGGVTPGDSYQWLLDGEGRPRAWRIWVRVLPLGGAEFSWEGWTRLPTGALVATLHRFMGLRAVAIADPAGAESIDALEPGPDPFAPLLEAPPR